MLIETRLVDNPMLTAGLEDYQQATRGYVERRVEVIGNAMTRIGALCFIRRREPHHEKAAERFKALCESRYDLAGGAIDMSRTPVDTSPVAHDAGMAAKLDRTHELDKLFVALGKERSERLVWLIVLGVPAGQGMTRRPQMRAVDQALSDLNRLAEFFGLMGR